MVPPTATKVEEPPWHTAAGVGVTVIPTGDAFTVIALVPEMVQPELAAPVVVSNAVTVYVVVDNGETVTVAPVPPPPLQE